MAFTSRAGVSAVCALAAGGMGRALFKEERDETWEREPARETVDRVPV